MFMVTACGYKYLIWHKGTIAWAYGVSFPCGLLIAEYKKSINKFIRYLTGVLIITSIALLFVPHETFIKMIFPLVLSLSLFFIIGFLNIKKFYGVEVLATMIGNCSFFMYLNEALIIGLISKNLKLANLSLALCSIVASFCLAVIMYRLYQLIQRENKL